MHVRFDVQPLLFGDSGKLRKNLVAFLISYALPLKYGKLMGDGSLNWVLVTMISKIIKINVFSQVLNNNYYWFIRLSNRILHTTNY